MSEHFTIRMSRLRQSLLLATALLPALLVAVFIAGRWPEYWKWIASEATPMTSLEVAVMYTTALACWAAAAYHYLHQNSILASKRWLVLGAGFLWLAMDDRFAIHERIRDKFLAPHHVVIPLLPIAPGDFLLLGYVLIGLIVLRWLWPALASRREVKVRFLLGAGIASLAVVMDAYDVGRLTVDIQRLEQTIEECLELCAQVLFLQSVLLAWLHDLELPDGRAQVT